VVRVVELNLRQLAFALRVPRKRRLGSRAQVQRSEASPNGREAGSDIPSHRDSPAGQVAGDERRPVSPVRGCLHVGPVSHSLQQGRKSCAR
jgi:hypothetical protein